MRKIYTLPRLSLSNGYISVSGRKVHIRQGDMDGACGPYSLMISLMINEIITFDEVVDLNHHDGRTRLGKFLDKLFLFGSLVRQGTTMDDLYWLGDCFKNHPNGKVSVDFPKANTQREKAKTVISSLNMGEPVIIGLEWQGGDGHWCVAIGYEEVDGAVTKIFTLDPGYTYIPNSYWNGIIEVCNDDGSIKNSGRLSCNYLTADPSQETKCQINEIIQINVR